MNSSVSNWTSVPSSLPSCDAWSVVSVGSAVSNVNSVGMAAPSRVSAGRYNFNFSTPARFQNGAYCAMTTIEAVNDTGYAGLGMPCPVVGGNPTGATSTFNNSFIEVNTWGYDPPAAGGCTASVKDLPTSQYRVNFAAFCFSADTELRVVTGGTFAWVPGASGYGVSGATYQSAATNLLSQRSAVAYGTIVIPPVKGSVCAYVENGYNISGVSAGGNGVFDLTFNKALNTANYCVVLSGEFENAAPANINTDVPPVYEYSLLMVRAGASNQFKTKNGFRVENLKQNSTDNGWTTSSSVYGNGLTERIHFMVFGGGTYGQP